MSTGHAPQPWCNGATSPAWPLSLGCVLLTLLLQASPAAEDPYLQWSHGHPHDALPALITQAERTDRWDAWLDAGLAAAAAHERGKATALLLRARERAPEREEPREAMRALDLVLPPSWFTRLGPIAWPGSGWPAAILFSVMGLALGYACCARRNRARAAVTALVLAVLVAPGQLAMEWEHQVFLVGVVRDTHLLDSAGNPGLVVQTGTIAVRDPQAPWADRLLVTLPDGSRGYLPIADTVADAGPGPEAP